MNMSCRYNYRRVPETWKLFQGLLRSKKAEKGCFMPSNQVRRAMPFKASLKVILLIYTILVFICNLRFQKLAYVRCLALYLLSGSMTPDSDTVIVFLVIMFPENFRISAHHVHDWMFEVNTSSVLTLANQALLHTYTDVGEWTCWSQERGELLPQLKQHAACIQAHPPPPLPLQDLKV